MRIEDEIVSEEPEPRRAVPQVSDASSFGADCLLIGSFVIALGTPIAHRIGVPHSVPTAVFYVVAIIAIMTALPFVVWMLHWGRPVPRRVRRIAYASLLYQLPVLAISAIAVAVDMERVLLGVAIMSFAAGVLVALAGERFREYPAPLRLILARTFATVCTPVMVLAFTQYVPHGADIVVDWAIPIPVVGACAVGVTQGFKRQMRLRDRVSMHGEE